VLSILLGYHLTPSGKHRANLRGVGIFDVLEDNECLFGMMDGLRAFSELVQQQTHIPEIISFASAVTNLAMNKQCLRTRSLSGPA
jgi:hypothetical protein